MIITTTTTNNKQTTKQTTTKQKGLEYFKSIIIYNDARRTRLPHLL
jgi:hypothetical protein